MRSYLFVMQHHVNLSSQRASWQLSPCPGLTSLLLWAYSYLSVSKTHDDKRFRGSYAFKEVPAAPGPGAAFGSFRTVVACCFTMRWMVIHVL